MEEFRNIDWDNNLKTYKKDTDLSFELFLRKIKFLYNKNSPFSTPKQKIKRDTSKPWMTSGILKSINVKNQLYNFAKLSTPPIGLFFIKNLKTTEIKQ